MALILPWAGLAVGLLAVTLLLAAWFWPQRFRAAGGVPFATARRLRALPRFRQLVRRQLRWLLLETAALLVAIAGLALLIARPVEARPWEQARGNRDIMLCLDVSGSMAPVDKEVLRSYARLAEQLEGERIGLTMFDASGVTIFPLTDDSAYIRDQLAHAEQEINEGEVIGTRVGDSGTSLIADGLIGCLERFDHRDKRRSRTVVFATDNQTSGQALYTLEEAFTQAHRDGALVFGVVPIDNSATATEELAQATRQTGGDVLPLAPDADVTAISDAVARTERTALTRQPRLESEELTWPGVALALMGLALAALARHWRERE